MKKIRAWIMREYTCRFRRRDLEKRFAWLNYEVGLGGCGPSLLDIKPAFPRPTFCQSVEDELEVIKQDEMARRKSAFRQSCIDVLGEDPEDWV
jgi:hypothetical protein